MQRKRTQWRLGTALFATVFLLGLVILSSEAVHLVSRVSELGAVWSWVVGSLASVVAIALLGLIWGEWRGWMMVRRVERLQHRLSNSAAHTSGLHRAVSLWSRRLEEPSAALADFDLAWHSTDKCITLEPLETLMQSLDARCESEIRREAARTGVLVSLSGVPLLDAVLCCWRNLRLIRRIAQIYGGRPGMIGTLRLGRMVLAHAVTVDITQHAADVLSARVGALAAVGGQGLVAATLTVRLGLWTQSVCRPLPMARRTIGGFVVASAADEVGHQARRTVKKCAQIFGRPLKAMRNSSAVN